MYDTRSPQSPERMVEMTLGIGKGSKSGGSREWRYKNEGERQERGEGGTEKREGT